MYIFVEMTLSSDWQTSDNSTFSVNTDMLSFSIAEGWTYLSTEDSKCVYYLSLGVGETLADKPIIADNGKITVSDSITADQLSTMTGISISLRAVAAQNDGKTDVEVIWEQVKN